MQDKSGKFSCKNYQFQDGLPVADPGTAGGPGPPTPVKTSQKKDGHRTGPQVSRVIRQISGSATGLL